MTDYTNGMIYLVGVIIIIAVFGGLAWEVVKFMAVMKYLMG